MRIRTNWNKALDALPDELAAANDWRRRLATLMGAVLIGFAALGFAWFGDRAQHLFFAAQSTHPWLNLVGTPVMFVAIAYIATRFVPQTRGSGIPQVMAAARATDESAMAPLVSLKTALMKVSLTVAGLFSGAPVGREGPTVQLAAAFMVQVHRVLRVPLTPGVLIAGGAAGVAAAFNTPLAGIAFAIEELAVAYEQRVAVLVMGAVMIAGLTAQGIAGDYVYFGHVTGALEVREVLLVAPLAGIGGGMLGGLFSRGLLTVRGPGARWGGMVGRRPLVTALLCGLVVGAIGLATGGATSGTGYGPTAMLLKGGDTAYWFGPAKFLSALATSISGIPGGIFAPSLAIGAGFGDLLTPLFPSRDAGLIVLMGMAGYFTGVVRAPLTAVIILSEATGSSYAILPLFATALIGDWTGAMVCRERLYHALSRGFLPPPHEEGGGKDQVVSG
ncbi:chloride channel protein [Tsuneonella deserti]|nr:chloride channel protein [Tsuneonella deserti]